MINNQTYRLRGNVECVLAITLDGPRPIPVGTDLFIFKRSGYHPNAGEPTEIAELVSGKWDGVEFWLEPSWMNHFSEWADPC